jgi:hypothetical protein
MMIDVAERRVPCADDDDLVRIGGVDVRRG